MAGKACVHSPWDAIVIKLARITGPTTICRCIGCGHEAPGGTAPYASASTGEERYPEDFYTDGCSESVYCSICAVKLAAVDQTRSISRFFTDTAGTQIDPEVFA